MLNKASNNHVKTRSKKTKPEPNHQNNKHLQKTYFEETLSIKNKILSNTNKNNSNKPKYINTEIIISKTCQTNKKKQRLLKHHKKLKNKAKT